MTDLVAILHVSRPDFHLALKLVTWCRWLAQQPTATPYPFVVFTAKNLETAHVLRLQSILFGWEGAQLIQNALDCERPNDSYAHSANLSFKSALEATEHHFPGCPTLWFEADCIPTRPSWAGEIDAEYKRLGKPFLGDMHALCPIPHMTGNAVYPPDWRAKSPSIAALPKPNPAQGWDTLCAHETLPQSAKSNLIQQAWFHPVPRFSEGSHFMKAVHPQTVLFHRSKDGTLIDVLAKRQGCPPIPLHAPLCPPTPSKVHRLMSPQAAAGGLKVEPRG